MDFIFSQIARNHNTTPEEIRKEITAAMNYAQDNATPSVQEKWAAIPKQGDLLTADELINYLAKLVTHAIE